MKTSMTKIGVVAFWGCLLIFMSLLPTRVYGSIIYDRLWINDASGSLWQEVKVDRSLLGNAPQLYYISFPGTVDSANSFLTGQTGPGYSTLYDPANYSWFTGRFGIFSNPVPFVPDPTKSSAQNASDAAAAAYVLGFWAANNTFNLGPAGFFNSADGHSPYDATMYLNPVLRTIGYHAYYSDNYTTAGASPVPLPGAWLLFGAGVAILFTLRRRITS